MSELTYEKLEAAAKLLSQGGMSDEVFWRKVFKCRCTRCWTLAKQARHEFVAEGLPDIDYTCEVTNINYKRLQRQLTIGE